MTKKDNKRHTKDGIKAYASEKHIPAPYPHFRYYKKSKHPALITGEYDIKEYNYRKVTHSEKEAGRKNEKVYPNPNPKDKVAMYIGKRVRHDNKKYFGPKLPWEYKKK